MCRLTMLARFGGEHPLLGLHGAESHPWWILLACLGDQKVTALHGGI